jgi:hypothetical protein
VLTINSLAGTQIDQRCLRTSHSFWQGASMPSGLIVPESGSWGMAILRMSRLFPATFGSTTPNVL